MGGKVLRTYKVVPSFQVATFQGSGSDDLPSLLEVISDDPGQVTSGAAATGSELSMVPLPLAPLWRRLSVTSVRCPLPSRRSLFRCFCNDTATQNHSCPSPTP